jgi:hypothetical protein
MTQKTTIAIGLVAIISLIAIAIIVNNWSQAPLSLFHSSETKEMQDAALYANFKLSAAEADQKRLTLEKTESLKREFMRLEKIRWMNMKVAMFAGFFVSGLLGVVAILGGAGVGIYSVIKANPDTNSFYAWFLVVVALLSWRKSPKEAMKVRIQELQFAREEAKRAFSLEQERQIIETQDPILMVPTNKHSSAYAMAQGHLSGPNIFLGYKEDGQPLFKAWKNIMSLNIGGMPEHGKSNFFALVVAQFRAFFGIVWGIDLHGENEESLLGRLGEIGKLSGVEIVQDDTEVIEMQTRIMSEFKYRQTLKNCDHLPKILVPLSEVIGLYKAFPEIATLHHTIVTEGRKYRIYAVADAQEWSAEAVTSTKVRNSVRTFACHRMDPAGANVFMKKKPGGVDCLEKGELFLQDKGRETQKLYAPLMGIEDMSELARLAKPINYTGEHVEESPAVPVFPALRLINKHTKI